MTELALLLAALCALPAINTFVNASLLRTPPLPAERPSVAILIPARDEAARIEACLDAALASEGVDFEVIVLDDQSTDATADIVRKRAALDARLRLAQAPPLPPGWKGKPHACQVLAGLTDRPLLLFIDADVLLAPDAAARLAPPPGISLVSGVPRQLVSGLIETAVVPMINFLIFGYLPVAFMRRFSTMPALTAACGQLMMMRAADYARAGGHAAVKDALHDGHSRAISANAASPPISCRPPISPTARCTTARAKPGTASPRTPPRAWRRRAPCPSGPRCWRAASCVRFWRCSISG
jgi:hypothetical protein